MNKANFNLPFFNTGHNLYSYITLGKGFSEF